MAGLEDLAKRVTIMEYFSLLYLPAYVPPLFEGTLLGAGLLTAAGFLKGALLPQWHDWAFECDFFRTDEHGNGYFILLEGGSEGHAAVLAEALHPDACEYVHGKGGRA